MPPAFSRLQLAAVLIEYDNDPENPNAPFRSAHDSAVLAQFRRTARSKRNSVDYLGVTLPTDSESVGGRGSILVGGGDGDRQSHGSIDALRNPFGPDETVDSDHGPGSDGEVEVDLASWGLDSFIPKEKESKSAPKKAYSSPLPDSQAILSFQRGGNAEEDLTQRRALRSRPLSLGTFEHLTAASSRPLHSSRRRSVGTPLDLAEKNRAPLLHRRYTSSHAIIETLTPESESVLLRSRTRSPAHDLERSSYGPAREHTTSSAGLDFRLSEEERNPFSVRAPSPDRASRFDPKAVQSRRLSAGSRGLLDDENPFDVPAPPVTSIFDPKAMARTRTLSNASMGSRLPLDDDGLSIMTGRTRDRPYSTMDLLRPKVLVMPSPLQLCTPPDPPPAPPMEGFRLSTDGPPLLPIARPARRSVAFDSSVPSASNLLTPNPRISLSLSQLTFRNTLLVDGQRDISYSDIDGALPRATTEGERVREPSPEPQPSPEPKQQEAQELAQLSPDIPPEDPPPPSRPAGRLFGKSLIDDLEARKAQMRSKQRVFTGDDRPSMMARGPMHRSSTLVDPASLQTQPVSPVGPRHSEHLARRKSASMKPLLSFNESEDVSGPSKSRMPKTRSVFGVDTIWERELAKLHELEQRETEEQKRREAEEELQSKKKKKRKGKKKGNVQPETIHEPVDAPSPAEPISPPDPPEAMLEHPRRNPPLVPEDDTNSLPSQDSREESAQLVGRSTEVEKWSILDDEDDGPRRTTSSGPRYLGAYREQSQPAVDDDSDEDVPLAATLSKVMQRVESGLASVGEESDDEEQPLSVLLSKSKLSFGVRPTASSSASGAKLVNSDDDDDQPLALRMSMAPSLSLGRPNEGGDDDDDRPLAFHPAQQRRTQYNMLAQQQQMMMQTQLRNSMFFGQPNMMTPGFFGPPPPMMMMPPTPLPAPSPPPITDAGKYVWLDQWRHNVAVEGRR